MVTKSFSNHLRSGCPDLFISRSLTLYHMFILFAERAYSLLREHRVQQSTEREKLAKHRSKCFGMPSKYFGIAIDGMDQKKTEIPHFRRMPKDVDGKTLINVHVVGCLVFSHVMQPLVFLNYVNIRNDGNLTITIIQHVISTWEGSLPEVLYLQLDNTARENKNTLVLSYLNMLVAKKVFKKIKVGFLLVGHTHDNIDQMFSRFSVALGQKDALTLPELTAVIEGSYTPRPRTVLLNQVADFRSFIWARQGDGSTIPAVKALHNQSFQHQFKITSEEVSPDVQVTCMRGKRFSTSPYWAPAEGLRLIIDLPDREIMACRQEHLEASGGTESRFSTALEYMLDVKKGLEPAMRYLGSAQDWWATFWNEQEEIAASIEEALPAHLIHTWNWYERSGHPDPVEPPSELAVAEEELRQVVMGADRPMYTGAYRSVANQTAEEERMNGDLTEIQVDDFVAVEAGDDPQGRPFWLAKVLTTDFAGSELSIQVQWWKTENTDAYLGRYVPEVIQVQDGSRDEASVDDDVDDITFVPSRGRSRSRGSRRRGRGRMGGKVRHTGARYQPHVQILPIGEGQTNILAYGFSLTAGNTLPRRGGLVRLIQRKLFEIRSNPANEPGRAPRSRLDNGRTSDEPIESEDADNLESSDGEEDIHACDADGLLSGEEPTTPRIVNFVR